MSVKTARPQQCLVTSLNTAKKLGLLVTYMTKITWSHSSVTSVVRATPQVNVRRQNYPSHHTKAI